MSGRRPMFGFLALTAALALACMLLSEVPRLLTWILIGLLSVAAVAAGVNHHRPRRPSAWWLVMAALLALTLGEAAHYLQVESFDRDQFPGVADGAYLLVFIPLLLAGMWRLVRSGTQALDRAAVLDALIITAAAALVSWSFLINPLVSDPSTTFLQTAVAAGYPVGGVLVLAVVARFATSMRLTAPLALQLLGVSGLLVASALYGAMQLNEEWRVSGAAMLGWLVLFAGWGASALHPAMRELTEPRALRPAVLTRARLVTLAVAAFLAPAALLYEATRGLPGDMVIRRALVVVLFLFVLIRLYAAVDHQLRGSARESGLRCASAALVRATTTEQVAEAVQAAVRHLLPPGTPHEVVVEFGGTAVPAGSGAATRAPVRAVLDECVRAQQEQSIHPLDPSLADQPGIPGAVLRCPLAPGATGAGQVGALYVAADAPMLVELETSLDVVATQAAMALERIRLTGEVNRRASEEYFRTLVHNAADVILIVDDDETIRYASPSAAAVLGTERPARIPDLIAPEDRVAVERTLRLSRADPRASVTADWRVLAADGRRLQAEAICRDLRADDTVSGLVVTLRDVTEQRCLQRELTYLAFHDQLTGLANRMLLRDRLEQALANQDGDGSIVGVLFLDVDDLKVVNDTLGHGAGDELLAETGRRLAAALRPPDLAARLGGDEFAGLIVGAVSPQQVEQVAHRVVACFAEPFLLPSTNRRTRKPSP